MAVTNFRGCFFDAGKEIYEQRTIGNHARCDGCQAACGSIAHIQSRGIQPAEQPGLSHFADWRAEAGNKARPAGLAEKSHQRKGINLRSRAGKNENFPIAGAETYSASSTQNLSENHATFPALEPGKIFKNRRIIMKTGLTKKQKVTEVFYNAKDPTAEIYTHDTKLKKRLMAYAAKYPELCRQTDDDGQGGLWFEITKERISIRLTAPYSQQRRDAASKLAKENNTLKNAQRCKL